MPSRTRNRLLVAGGIVAGILVLLALLPMLFGGKIAGRVKIQLNRSLAARVDWRSASLGLFHSFPNLTLGLSDLTVAGVGPFQGDTLAAVGELRVVVDLVSAIRSATGGSAPIVVRAVELDRPRIRLLALNDSTANWDITKKTAAASPGGGAGAVSVSLHGVAINRGDVGFENRAAKLAARFVGLDGTLSGDFSAKQADLATRMHVDSATVAFAGITYLNRVRTDLTADVGADFARKSFTLKPGTGVRLNELTVAASGSVAQLGDSAAGNQRLALDLTLGAPKTSFRNILSLVPAVWSKSFQTVKTSGTLALSGRVKGEYGKHAFPAFAIGVKVDNGAFQYPDLPLPARDIALDLALDNPGGSADSTVVNLRRFHLVLGRNPVDARMTIRTPVSDPDVDASLRGTVDLADLRRTLKMEKVQELSGTIAADAAVHARLSAVDKGQYDRVAASGTVSARNLAVRSAALKQPIAVQEATLALAPKRAELRSLTATLGSSDLRGSGFVENLLGYMLRNEDLRGSATLASNRFVLDEWKSDTGSLSAIPVPKGLDLTLDATAKELLYGKIRMSDARGRLRVKDERLTLDSFTVNTLGGSIGVTGFYETTHPAKPTFDVGLKIASLDIPSAFATFTTVQKIAPIAQYARGSFSTQMRLNGPLSQDMTPVFAALSGNGALQTTQLELKNVPALQKIVDKTKLTFLTENAIRSFKSQFAIENGRFKVQPFTVPIGGTTMTVSGSNGFDQTLDYTLQLRIPRSMIPDAASQALAGLASKAAAVGLNLATAPEIPLGIRLTGKVGDPTVGTTLGSTAGSAAQAAGQQLQQAAEQRATAAVDTAKQRLAAETQRLVQQAESSATKVRADARTLADSIKATANRQADSLVARSGNNPLARAGATVAADRLRKEADARSAQLVGQADARADSLVSAARKRAAP
jgi:hypothetical protein